MTINAVIVDDEEDARATLRSFLRNYCPQVNLVGEADGVVSGNAIIKKTKPDVVLLDIRMEDGTGFDLIEESDRNFSVIFTTAYDQYAVKAFKFSAIDYLLKPIDPDELKLALSKVELNSSSNKFRLNGLLQNDKEQTFGRITLSAAEGYIILDISEITRVESASNYSHLYKSDGKRVTIAKSLKEFEELLPDSIFFRIHQSHLVNLRLADKFTHENGGRLTLKDGTKLPVARRRKDEMIKILTSF